MDCVAYYIVASIVRNTLAVIIVMEFALDLVEFAVIDKNSGGFAEQVLEGISHFARRRCFAEYQITLPPLFIQPFITLKVAVYGLIFRGFSFDVDVKDTANDEIYDEFRPSEGGQHLTLNNKTTHVVGAACKACKGRYLRWKLARKSQLKRTKTEYSVRAGKTKAVTRVYIT